MSSTIVGLRVVRGPDWKWNDQDGGDGHLGTIVDVGSERPPSTVDVLWDSGSLSHCRIGAEGAHDLRMFDSAPCGMRHEGVTCDVCNVTDFAGIRWKCCVCSNYDLCTACYMSEQHDTGHDFFRIVIREDGRVRLPPRAKSSKCMAKGLFPGASVVRGRDWRWDNQDERSPNRVGIVVSIAEFASKGVRDAVRVRWSKDGLAHVYRVGYGGKVDVQCDVAADGGSYYPAHLPVVGGVNSNGRDGDAAFAQGARVKCQVQESELRELQKGRGEWQPRMIDLIGQIGIVHGFTDEGNVLVQYYGESQEYEYNPAALTKVESFKVGDKVRIADDAEKVKACQDGHGGWVDDMRLVLGMVGEVDRIDEDGDVRVKLRMGRVTLNPVCVALVSSEDEDLRKGSPPSSPDASDLFQRLLGGSDLSSAAQGFARMLAASTAASRALGRSSVDTRFKIGEKVRVTADLSRAASLQEGHGGWNEAMEGSLGKVGKVVFVHDSGDLRVKVAGRHWTYNPSCLEAVGDGAAPDASSSSSSDSDSEDKLLRTLSTGLQGLMGGKTASGFEKGDIVTLISDMSTAKQLQAGHGEWVSSMEGILGRTGKVVAAFPTGDLRVKVNGRKWTLNPACCALAGNAEREALAAASSSSESSSDDESGLLSKMLGGALGGGLLGGALGGALSGALGGAGLGGALGGAGLSGGLFGMSDEKKLLQAIMQDDASTVREVLSRSKGQANSRVAGKTPLMIAAHQGCSEEIIRMLLDAGADVNCADDDGDAPLHYAILGRSQDVVKKLLANGSQKDAANKRGHTPLHIASAFRNEDVALVSLLLEHGCNPNVQDTDGDTPLQCAIDKGYKEVTLALIAHPATDLTLKNQRGFNALHQAVLCSDEEAVRAIVRKRPIILEERNDNGFTPLHMAAQHGQRAIAEILTKEGKASIEQLSERNETPLLLAVSHGQKEVADVLMDCGASIFARDERGDTCLHLAVSKHQLLHGSSASTPGAKKSLELIRKLLEKGADQSCKNAKGKSAADLATGPHTRALLEQYRRQR